MWKCGRYDSLCWFKLILSLPIQLKYFSILSRDVYCFKYEHGELTLSFEQTAQQPVDTLARSLVFLQQTAKLLRASIFLMDQQLFLLFRTFFVALFINRLRFDRGKMTMMMEIVKNCLLLFYEDSIRHFPLENLLTRICSSSHCEFIVVFDKVQGQVEYFQCIIPKKGSNSNTSRYIKVYVVQNLVCHLIMVIVISFFCCMLHPV